MARMKNFEASMGSGGAGGGSTGPVTAANYHDRAVSFCKRSGRANGDHPVIERGSPEWDHWMRYFQRLGISHGRQTSYANATGRMTVPTMTPDEFDPGWSMRPITIDAQPTSKTERQTYLETLPPAEREASRERVRRMHEEIRRSIAAASFGSSSTKRS